MRKDFEVLRESMVNEQLILRGISDPAVIRAMSKVPRHEFVLEKDLPEAYADHPLPIGEGQTISQPYMVALMTACLELKGKQRILEIGTGSGYQAAILAELVKEVYTVERFPSLVKRAKEIFEKLGYQNIKTKLGNGTVGWPEFAPFDGIIVTAASPHIPPPLIEQLQENGNLVIPLGESLSQVLTVVKKIKDKIQTKQVCGCVFVPLVGKYGWRQSR